MGLVSYRMENKSDMTAYRVPLTLVANLCFCWALLGTLTLFFASAGRMTTPWLGCC